MSTLINLFYAILTGIAIGLIISFIVRTSFRPEWSVKQKVTVASLGVALVMTGLYLNLYTIFSS